MSSRVKLLDVVTEEPRYGSSVAIDDDDDAGAAAILPQDGRAWRLLHAASFLVGGLTFVAGTSCYYLPAADAATQNSINWAAAALYALGSLAFLTVDLQELITYKEPILRVNIALSASGSLAYVVGSVGFAPAVLSLTPLVGTGGFIFGSALIAVSQTWKTIRLGTPTATRFSAATLFRTTDVSTAVGVEASAGAGAVLFLIGTIMYQVDSVATSWLSAVFGIWMGGSMFFTLGAFFLSWRHFVMGVS